VVAGKGPLGSISMISTPKHDSQKFYRLIK
ncbi:MAG: hypothetical protein ACI9TA_003138, partial [Reinekea sp.]